MSGNLRPVELSLEGFRSFVDKTTIKFPDIKRGAILISGSYKDGETSSGSGKSTILMAMAFALGFCDIPNTELKSWYGKNKLNVKLVLTDDDNTYEIIRNPKLKLVINGEKFGGTSAGAKEKLEEILKAPSELIKALTYRPQREKGTFLTNTDSKNKEFLTKILSLNSIESASDSFLQELNSINFKRSSLESSISVLKSTLSNSNVSDAQITEAQATVNSLKTKLESMGSVAEDVAGYQESIDSINVELSRIAKASNEVLVAKNQNLAIRVKVGELQSEISELKKGVCVTCKREWDQFQSLVSMKAEDISNLLDSMKSNIALINSAAQLINPQHKAQMEESRQLYQIKIGEVSAPVGSATQSYNLAVSNLDNLNRMKKMNSSYVEQLSSQEIELKGLDIEVHLLDHCVKIIGRQGFLGGIFDEVLSEIKMRTNDLMVYMPNINTFSLDVSSTSVTQTGKVNKKINTVMYKDGMPKSLKSMSGGQQVASELCADLAVSETIKSRSGSRLGWVGLDEAMEGLDVETKIAALDAIKSKVDGLLIIVDHSTEIKESFDMVIDVQFDGKRSWVEQ